MAATRCAFLASRLSSLTISRVLDGSDRHTMGMQLHLHLCWGKSEDSQGSIIVSCSHTQTFLPRRWAPAHTATGLTKRVTQTAFLTFILFSFFLFLLNRTRLLAIFEHGSSISPITLRTSPDKCNHHSLPHLVEHLELHHQFIAGGWPHSHTAILTAGGKVALIRVKDNSVHLDRKVKKNKASYKTHFPCLKECI